MSKYRLEDKIVWEGREAEVVAINSRAGVYYLLRVKNYDEGHRGSVSKDEMIDTVEGFTGSDKRDCWWVTEESIEKLLERKDGKGRPRKFWMIANQWVEDDTGSTGEYLGEYESTDAPPVVRFYKYEEAVEMAKGMIKIYGGRFYILESCEYFEEPDKEPVHMTM